MIPWGLALDTDLRCRRFVELDWGGWMAQSIAARALWNGYVVTFDGAISEDEAEAYFFRTECRTVSK